MKLNTYTLTIPDFLASIGTDPKNGLSEPEIESSRDKFGKNELLREKDKSKFLLLLSQFNDPIIYIRIIAAIVNGVVSEPKDSIVIAVVVLLNTIIGFVQEIRAEAALKSLDKMTSPTSRVIRNGERKTIPTSEVVLGELILLESGDRVPADSRLIEHHNLQVDESMLTGESFAITKNSDATIPENAELGDRINLVYSGTIVQKGRAKAVAISIGKDTEFGKISTKVAESKAQQTPLQEKMESFSKKLSIAIMGAVLVIFIIGLFRGFDWLDMVLTSVGLAVSAIPEGLPVSITITLSVGLYQMAKRNAVIKKLAAVETLGSTNVICSDKTGTLTKNQMTVKSAFIGLQKLNVTGTGYLKEGVVYTIEKKEVKYGHNSAIDRFSEISKYCTESTIKDDGIEWKITGDPTEVALQIFAEKIDSAIPKMEVKVDIPFESENQFMAISAKNLETQNGYLYVKGGSDKILELSSKFIDSDGNIKDLDSKKQEQLEEIITEYSLAGLRVLTLAYKDFEYEKDGQISDVANLTFVGFAGIQDPIRDEAVSAVKECHNAGVDVYMITGDHIQTAKSIGKEINLAPALESPNAIRGREIESMTDDELFEKVSNTQVYARVAPEHKYRIVEQLQKHGKIVAMTGDGVNDAPALKKADIGIAMGSGTDVAKEASAMVLMDDNFISIVNAIRRGRVILRNLQHIILYILATSFGGLLTITASVLIGFPLPILPAQLLWINLVTDGTSTFPLAFENEHGNVMKSKPQPKNSPLLPRALLNRIAFAGIQMMIGTLGVFYYASGYTISLTEEVLPKSITMAFCTLAFYQIWNVQNSRSLDRSIFFNIKKRNGDIVESVGLTTNRILLAVMLLSITLQVSAVAIPFMNNLLNTVPLNLEEWTIVAGIPFTIIIFVELVKFINAKRK
ncbi:MAG: cation-transporting P-type ATPase [Candidatus Kapaibacteriales bacterium]